MRDFVLASYVIMAAAGFAGLASLGFLAIRTRRPLARLLAVLDAILLGALALTIGRYYAVNVASAGADPGASPLSPIALASILAQAALYALLAAALLGLRAPGRSRRAVRTTALLLCAADVILPLAYLAAAAVSDLLGRAIPRGSLGLIGFALTGGAVALSGLAFILSEKSGEPPSIRFLLDGFGWACLGFIPLTLLEALLDSSSSWPYKPVSLDFLFYFAVSALACAAFALSLASDSRQAFGGATEETSASLGLTEREAAMAGMIARGLSNKEIAAELGISPATVRTHIYNLYKKAGARSRVELLNKLSSR